MCRLASEFGTVCERGKLRVNFNLIRWVLTATSGAKTIIVSAGHVYNLLHQREKRGSTENSIDHYLVFPGCWKILNFKLLWSFNLKV